MSFTAGIYIGTREVRGILSDDTGIISNQSIIKIKDEPFTEPEPELLWQKVASCLTELIPSATEVAALGISSVSGAIPIDADGKALSRVIMGPDNRFAAEVKLIDKQGEELTKKLGYRFDSSSTLAGILWLVKEKTEIYRKTRKFVNISDFIVGKLTGEFSITDTSNALKAGYDIIDLEWPAVIHKLGLLPDNLPAVVKPGEPVSSITPSVANQIGIPGNTKVIAGTTDQLTLLVSSGAISPGQWNSHIGMNLEVKGVSSKLIKDKLGRFYSHLHPENSWIVIGESSVGRKSLEEKFPGEDFQEPLRQSSLIVYPLNQQGEKLPFLNPDAQGFMIGKPRDKQDIYSGYLEGIGFIEKWIFELFEECGFEIGDKINTTGLGENAWLQMRANILEKVIVKPRAGSPEMGAAILAASKTIFRNLSEAVKAMVHIEKFIEPDQESNYLPKYRKFRQVCRAIGYE